MAQNAKLVTVWNGGIEIQTSCNYDPKTNSVLSEPVEPHFFNAIIDQYLIFKDSIIRDYKFSI